MDSHEAVAYFSILTSEYSKCNCKLNFSDSWLNIESTHLSKTPEQLQLELVLNLISSKLGKLTSRYHDLFNKDVALLGLLPSVEKSIEDPESSEFRDLSRLITRISASKGYNIKFSKVDLCLKINSSPTERWTSSVKVKGSKVLSPQVTMEQLTESLVK